MQSPSPLGRILDGSLSCSSLGTETLGSSALPRLRVDKTSAFALRRHHGHGRLSPSLKIEAGQSTGWSEKPPRVINPVLLLQLSALLFFSKAGLQNPGLN